MWEVIKTQTFNKDLKRLGKSVKDLDKFIVGAEFALSHNPRIGKKTAIEYVQGLPMTEIPDNPKIILYYFITKDQVYLVGVKKEGDKKIDIIM